MKWNRTEKDPEKYVYYFEIVCFFRFFSLLISYICLRCAFSFYMVSEKTWKKVMGLYVHFLLSINIRVFLKFISLFLFDYELWKHIGLPKKISSWIKKKNCLYLDFLAILFWCFALLVKILKHDVMYDKCYVSIV